MDDSEIDSVSRLTNLFDVSLGEIEDPLVLTRHRHQRPSARVPKLLVQRRCLAIYTQKHQFISFQFRFRFDSQIQTDQIKSAHTHTPFRVSEFAIYFLPRDSIAQISHASKTLTLIHQRKPTSLLSIS